ncbi:hypothetical protein ACHAXH_001538 [Discostella pseudostelligera]
MIMLPKRPSSSSSTGHHRHLNNYHRHRHRHHGPFLLPLAYLLAALIFICISASSAASAAAAEELLLPNDNNSNVSFQQVFQVIDSNHDHSISEDEYLVAVNKLIGGGVGVGAGGNDASGIAAALANGGSSSGGGIGGGSGGDAPPLGMDYNPFASRNIKSTSSTTSTASASAAASTTAFFKGLVSSFSAILATEIGDKTFFIAAVLSMRNDRAAVFGGAILALIIMTILSTLMGLVLPALLPKKYTHIIGGLLFLYFGIKLLLDSRNMQNKVSEELEEVEEELAEISKKQSKARKKKRAERDGGKPILNNGTSNDDDDTLDVEDGGQQQQPQQIMENADSDMNGAKKRRGGGGVGSNSTSGRTIKHAPSSSGLSAAGNYSGGSWESVFVQSLTMTFLAEWGDRSQIATIALAAAKDPVGVAIGGCIGHSVCTGMAVIGGRMLASRISEKSVAFYGGLVFLVFGMHSVFLEE